MLPKSGLGKKGIEAGTKIIIVLVIMGVGVFFTWLLFSNILFPVLSTEESQMLSSHLESSLRALRRVVPEETGHLGEITFGGNERLVQVYVNEECWREIDEIRQKRSANLRECGIGDSCLCTLKYNTTTKSWFKGQYYDWEDSPSWLDGDYDVNTNLGNVYFRNGTGSNPENILSRFCKDLFEEETAIMELQCQEAKKYIEKKGEKNYYWVEATPNCLASDTCHYKYVLWAKNRVDFEIKGFSREGKYYVRKWLGVK